MSFVKSIPGPLHVLRNQFVADGFDIRLVGGCVRDWLAGNNPKDFDLCTDATPDEQKALFEGNGIRHIDTGLHHGTWTVVLEGQTYEITSLRTDVECDGRHAMVDYTRDWLLDLSRRDLTINAIMMTLDGEIIDPYDGAEDLLDGVVRFVGSAEERIREDYLRILRWFRFHSRFATGWNAQDVETAVSIKRNVVGLKHISRERVWSEISRLIVTDKGVEELLQIIVLGVSEYIDLPTPRYGNRVSIRRLENAHRHTRNPVTLMAAYLGDKADIDVLARKWHWSREEQSNAQLICDFMNNFGFDPLRDAKEQIVMTLFR